MKLGKLLKKIGEKVSVAAEIVIAVRDAVRAVLRKGRP